MATKKGNTISTKAAETKTEPKQVTVSSIFNAEAEKKTTAKATTEKKVVATEAKKVTETKKTTAEAKKAPAKKAEETKATAKKVEEPKKTVTKKATTTEKKATKTTAKKTTKKESNLYVQFQGMEFDAKQIEEAVKADFKAKNKKRTINSVSIYVKPEDMKAYYVIDGIIGDVAL